MSKPNRIFSIHELNKFIKMMMEANAVLQNVWVQGEISNFTHHSSGHMYFTLKDRHSRLRCIMFASHNQTLAFMPREGAKVLAKGNVSVYERDGQYQLYVTQMQPDGIGNLYLAYEQLKQKLEKEGLFASEAKRELPKHPRAIGVVTSPTGAAIRDIITTLQRRSPGTPILIYPVSVQGTHAAPSIVKALETLNERQEVDVIIVGRGGGSLEELWAFNEEAVARSIFNSHIPVISAVGHETDVTIADFVADLRAATPTAAAELAVPHHMELQQQLAYVKQSLQRGLKQLLQTKRERLQMLKRAPYFLYPHKHVLAPAQQLDRLHDRLIYLTRTHVNLAKEKTMTMERDLSAFNPTEQLKFTRDKLAVLQRQLAVAMQVFTRETKQRFATQVGQLDALSPLKVMQRGYSLVYKEDEQTLVKSIAQIQLGDRVKVRLTDGQIDCQVWGMEGEEDDGTTG